jgi:carboxymethylenebutenolidase
MSNPNPSGSAVTALESAGIPLHVKGSAGTGRAVVVLHQAPGLTPDIHAWLDRLAQQGYLAVAPELHHRRGVAAIDPFAEFGGDPDAFAAALPTDEELLEDVKAVLDALAGGGIEEVHLLGFSYGGRAAYLVASTLQVSSAVSWYAVGVHENAFRGNPGLPALTGIGIFPSASWLGLAGGSDPILVPGELEAWQKALTASGAPASLITYPEAGHAFDVHHGFGPDAPDTYRAAAFEDALSRTLAHFADNARWRVPS